MLQKRTLKLFVQRIFSIDILTFEKKQLINKKMIRSTFLSNKIYYKLKNILKYKIF